MPIINNVRELNERITFQSKQPAPGPEPGNIVTDLFSCWTHVRTQMIKDVKASFGTAHENTTDFVIRYTQPYEINNTMVIQWQEEPYEIVEINPDTGFKEFTVIVGRKIG